jgi:hypothetical protein
MGTPSRTAETTLCYVPDTRHCRLQVAYLVNLCVSRVILSSTSGRPTKLATSYHLPGGPRILYHYSTRITGLTVSRPDSQTRIHACLYPSQPAANISRHRPMTVLDGPHQTQLQHQRHGWAKAKALAQTTHTGVAES